MIHVHLAGLYSTIQDLGRYGYRNIGVPCSGVMDRYSAKLANALLDNDANSAVLEMTYQGVILEFNEPACVAITGASATIYIDDQPHRCNAVIAIKAGSIMKVGGFSYGARAYMAISGGFDCPIVLNSRSFYRGISANAIIKKGDDLYFNKSGRNIINRASIKPDLAHFHSDGIEVMKGPEYDLLTESMKNAILTNDFCVEASSNRMAYQLHISDESSCILSAKEIISSAVQPGTIQLTPAGGFIVLMRDCQTTGGYARILQLSESSINCLAQKRPGQNIQFNLLA